MVIYCFFSLGYQFWIWYRIFVRPGIAGVLLCLVGVTIGLVGFLVIQGILSVIILYIQTS
ncbi:MAG TPA: hypothetical protein DDW52_26875 [Planctomycetaceae bacterium]|nr:hypothetical protein [Planctomycetaceae bacterium]